MRLDAFLASALGESRSNVKKIIKEKRVSSERGLLLSASENIDGREIFVDGKKVEARGKIYLLMNKPLGYVSTTENIPESVLSLLPEQYRRRKIAPAGRLDKDTSGLLILTDDGDFAHNIISPSKHLDKVYKITASKAFSEADIVAFSEGTVLKDGTLCKPAQLKISEDPKVAFLTLREGKYHQVRRMVASRGNFVEQLERISIGEYTLDGIKEGEVVEFCPKERKKDV